MEFYKINLRAVLLIAFLGVCLSIPAPNPNYRKLSAKPNFQSETKIYMQAISIPYSGSLCYAGTPYQIKGKSLWKAVNSYVLGIKSIGISKFVAVYPYIGGTSSKNAINLINPSTYSLTFTGGVTHNGAGVSFAPAGYARPAFSPSSALSLNSTHISVCLSAASSIFYYAGCGSGGPTYLLGAANLSATTAALGTYINSNYCSVSISTVSGDYTLYRNNSTQNNLISGAGITHSCSVASGALASDFFQINGYNNSGVSASASASTHNLLTVGFGLTNAQALSLQTLNRLLKKTLNR